MWQSLEQRLHHFRLSGTLEHFGFLLSIKLECSVHVRHVPIWHIVLQGIRWQPELQMAKTCAGQECFPQLLCHSPILEVFHINVSRAFCECKVSSLLRSDWVDRPRCRLFDFRTNNAFAHLELSEHGQCTRILAKPTAQHQEQLETRDCRPRFT